MGRRLPRASVTHKRLILNHALILWFGSSSIYNLTANLQTITGLTTERVLRETGRVAFFDRRKLFRPDGTEKHPTEWDDDTAATGPVPFDKNAALEKAFKHLGLYEHDNTQRREDIRIIVELMG